MKIGVLGTGVVGQTISSRLVQLGHDVFMGSRDPANPTAITWAKKEGHHALFGTFADAASFGEIIFNCTLGSASLNALRMAGSANLKDKILIDLSNPINSPPEPWSLSICNTDSLGEQIQRAFPDARVVKTLNTINCNVMINPDKLLEKTDVFLSGNDIKAKASVAAILRDWFGWRSVIDLGDITTARGVEMFVVFWRDMQYKLGTPQFNIKVVTA